MTRPLTELLSPGDEGWTSITAWSAAGSRSHEVLPPVEGHRETALLRLQVTTRSVLGAAAWHSAGMLLDHGWLRLTGGVGSGLPDLLEVNEARLTSAAPPPYLVIGLDVLGGRFAVNGGALPCDPGEVAYFGPDTRDWLPTGLSHSAFVEWSLKGDTENFYEDLRWQGWEIEAQALALDELLSVYPPPFSEQGRDIGAASRRPVPWRELVGWLDNAASQLNG